MENVIYLDKKYPFKDMPTHYKFIDRRAGCSPCDVVATLNDLDELTEFLVEKYGPEYVEQNFAICKTKHLSVQDLMKKM